MDLLIELIGELVYIGAGSRKIPTFLRVICLVAVVVFCGGFALLLTVGIFAMPSWQGKLLSALCVLIFLTPLILLYRKARRRREEREILWSETEEN